MDRVLVLMSTYNGEKYLKEQLDSILNQKNVKVDILVRDDGSEDSTIDILKEYEARGLLSWYGGENLRSAKSFMNLIQQSGDYDFYAFSDQDDYWLPDKLRVAVEKIKKQDACKPLLYYSNTTLVDEKLELIETKDERRCFTSFSEAVISSNATGCTMCMNKVLRDIINTYTPDYQIMHDGWVHKVCLAVGGTVLYDDKSYIYYRQHGNNVVGGTMTPMKRWKRRIDTTKNNPCPRSRGIAEILKGYNDMMPDENIIICKKITEYKKSYLNRLSLLIDRNIHSSNTRIDFLYRLTVLFGLF